MISNQIMQNTIEDISRITMTELAVFDLQGKIVCSTDPERIRPARETLTDFAQGTQDIAEADGIVFAKAEPENAPAFFVAAVSGEDPGMIAKLAAMQLTALTNAYRERLDKDEFIKNLLLDNLLLVDVYNRAKKFEISPGARRVAIIVDSVWEHGQEDLENIRALFAGNEHDFVTAVDNSGIIVIRELAADEGYEAAQKTAEEIARCIHADERTRIAYGTIVKELKDLSRSFKEARMAIDVGRIFSPEKSIVAYSSLGIGRLIYQLPIPLCRMFIKEIFADRSPEQFDEETITTIQKFFENNLNVSETSRQLYIHRNTLVYRLDKIQKTTGLDLRIFEDAITFRIALMVVRYMKYMETLEH